MWGPARLTLPFGTWSGQQLAWGWEHGWGFGGRVGPVSVGVRKRGKPSQWKLPCGWLRRPQHCIYRELPAILKFFTVELTLSELRCQPGAEGRNTGLSWDSWIATELGAKQLGGWEWSMVSHLSSLTEKETLALGSVKIRVGDGQ